jgi:hypothetical protein
MQHIIVPVSLKRTQGAQNLMEIITKPLNVLVGKHGHIQAFATLRRNIAVCNTAAHVIHQDMLRIHENVDTTVTAVTLARDFWLHKNRSIGIKSEDWVLMVRKPILIFTCQVPFLT